MTRDSRENNALATVYLNLRGGKKKKSNWIEIATAVKWAVRRYGGVGAAAEKLGYSYELVRTIPTLLTLPKEVREQVRNGKILYDAAQRLARLKDPDQQRKTAQAIIGMTSHDARQVIQFAKRFPDRDPQDFRRQVESSKATTKEVHVVILPLREELFLKLRRQAQEENVSVEKFILGRLGDFVRPTAPGEQ